MKIDATSQREAEEDLSAMPAVPPRPVASPETRTLSAKSRASTTLSQVRTKTISYMCDLMRWFSCSSSKYQLLSLKLIISIIFSAKS